MIFKRIILENFRPYYGINEIELCSGKKNITLLKAENGSGKTTLLEGIKWCLYGESLNLTNGNPKIDGVESFVNKQKINELKDTNEKLTASIEIEFLENDKLYNLKREINFYKRDFQIDLTLKIDSKKDEKISNIQIEKLIKTIIPKEVDFFIDGERLKKIVPDENSKKSSKESQEAIKESIFRVLGIKSLENAVNDLEEFYKEVKKEYIKSDGLSEEEKEILTGLENTEDTIISKKREKKGILDNLESIREQIERNEDYIINLPEKYNLEESIQKDLLSLEINRKKISKDYHEVKKEYKEFISKESWKLISEKIFEYSLEKLSEKKNIGEIPTKYEKEFLEELLEIKKCICGNVLCEESEGYNEIISRLESAGTRENREIFNEIFYSLKNISTVEINQKKDKLKLEKIKKLEELKEYEMKIDTLTEALDTNILEVKNEKKEEIKKLQLEENNSHKEIGKIEKEIELLTEKRNTLDKRRIELNKKQIGRSSIKIKKDFSEKTLENFKILKEKKEELGRKGLQEKISQVYERVNGKNYLVDIDKEFRFEIYDNDGKKASLSKGEEKNKALSFIGGLVYYAKELKKLKQESIDNEGGIYPLVLDAPYGDLDNSYRKDFTKFLPQISEQVIVMVSSGQWNNDIERVVENNIGNIYNLVNLRRDKKDKKYDITEIRREK